MHRTSLTFRHWLPTLTQTRVKDFRALLTRLPHADDGYIALPCGDDFVVSIQGGAQFACHPRDDLADAYAYSEFEVAVFHDTPSAPWATPTSAPWLFAYDTPWSDYVDPRTPLFSLRYAPTATIHALLTALVAPPPSHGPGEGTWG